MPSEASPDCAFHPLGLTGVFDRLSDSLRLKGEPVRAYPVLPIEFPVTSKEFPVRLSRESQQNRNEDETFLAATKPQEGQDRENSLYFP
jgi:hypothetical protein